MIYPDPRKNTGPFAVLCKDIMACKTAQTCPTLNTRQFYFEPNPFTIPFWKSKELFADGISYRVMFVCESPGPSALEGDAENIEPCFYGSPRDLRFQEIRRKYDLENCYITNTVKCGVRRGARHSGFEVEKCRRFLVREIDLIQPQVVVGVGGNAYRTLRTEVLKYLRNPPVLFHVTHYASRRNPKEAWNNEFPSYSGSWHGCVLRENDRENRRK